MKWYFLISGKQTSLLLICQSIRTMADALFVDAELSHGGMSQGLILKDKMQHPVHTMTIRYYFFQVLCQGAWHYLWRFTISLKKWSFKHYCSCRQTESRDAQVRIRDCFHSKVAGLAGVGIVGSVKTVRARGAALSYDTCLACVNPNQEWYHSERGLRFFLQMLYAL